MLKKLLGSKNFIFVSINILVILFQIFLISFFYEQMNQQIPLWYTKNWGLDVLANKNNILVIPFISTLVIIFSFFMLKISEKL
ncbi:hypothetical protein EBU91_05265, partial [bacterium]|nr:hypothetical protein [bacterium]